MPEQPSDGLPTSKREHPAAASNNGVPSLLPRTGSILRVLTATQNCSALVFSVFIGVHLVSPLAAAVGGTTAADNALLLAREYYLPIEPFAVYIPLGLHLASSTLRRAITTLKTRRRPPITPHLVTGWILPFLLLPHITTHRLIPASDSPPISGLSPSELGFEFVGWGLYAWPIWSTVSYLGLVGLTVWHTGVGMMKVVSWLKRGRGSPPPSEPAPPPRERTAKEDQGDKNGQPTRRVISKRRKLGLRGILAGFLGIIAIGLARVANESSSVSPLLSRRYKAVYAAFPSFR